MTNKQFEVSLKCLFCDSVLKGDTKKEYKPGDTIKCQECGESNNYDALMEVVAEEGKLLAAEYAKEEIKKILSKAFKK